MKNLRRYLSLIFYDWTALMSGLLSVILWGAAALSDPFPIPVRISFIVAAIIALFVAGYRAWLNEHLQIRTEQEKQKLRLAIDQLIKKGNSLRTTLLTKPFVTEDEAGRKVNEWTAEAMDFVEKNFPEFAGHFASGAGSPHGVGFIGTTMEYSGIVAYLDHRLVRLGELLAKI